MPVLELTEGEIISLEAIDATTGLPVAGVVVNNMVIYATDSVHDNPAELTLADIYLSPTAPEVGSNDGALIRPEPIPGRGD
jgi:hypothetical protein